MLNLISDDNDLCLAYQNGLQNLCAIMVRNIHTKLSGDKKYKLYEYLYEVCLEFKLESVRNFKIRETLYLKLYKTFIEYMANKSIVQLDKQLDILLLKRWSCWDLENSLFLCPDEIRTCCKRFFVKDRQKGDVVLIKIDQNNQNMDTIVDFIFKRKQQLVDDINKGINNECGGCPYLQFTDWPTTSKKVKKLSLEYNTICNLKCIYCSDKYYGGMKSRYNVEQLVTKIIQENIIDKCELCVWGGGEPTLNENFSTLLSLLSTYCSKQLVITNAVVFSETVAQLLENERIKIVTSIDAGSESTYQMLRGKNKYIQVLKNLKAYATKKADNIMVKYIVLHENNGIRELSSFADDVEKNCLTGCCFQLSSDFSHQVMTWEQFEAGVILYALLYSKNVKVVFFDELFRERIPALEENKIQILRDKLKALQLPDIIANPVRYHEVILWGSDNQIKYLLHNTIFFQRVKVKAIIHSDKNRIGSQIDNYVVEHPLKQRDTKTPIIFAAVQGMIQIYEEFRIFGFKEERLIKEIIL